MRTYPKIFLFLISVLSSTWCYASTLQTLTLSIKQTSLNKDANTTLKVEATYSDNTTKDVTDTIKWLIDNPKAIQIQSHTLTAKQDTNTTLRAKLDSQISNAVTLDLYWEVEGYRLPSEPDPAVNNATLLGVDVNANGVRDDVERWIYNKYKEYVPCKEVETVCHGDNGDFECYKTICEEHPVPYHPVVRAVAMQGARAAQIIIQEPEKARETREVFAKAYLCSMVVDDMKDKQGRKLYEHYLFGDDFKKVQFNTVQRARAFAKYNFYLSGGVYELPTDDKILEGCGDDVKELLKDLK